MPQMWDVIVLGVGGFGSGALYHLARRGLHCDRPTQGPVGRKGGFPGLKVAMAFLVLSSSVHPDDDLVGVVFDAWEAQAQSVQTLHVVFAVEQARPAGSLQTQLSNLPNRKMMKFRPELLSPGDIVLNTQLDYSFDRTGRERLRRWGDCPTAQKGIVQHDVTYVRRGREVRDLTVGGPNASLPYDTFGIRERSYLIEAHLLPLRMLLNVGDDERPFFDRTGFHLQPAVAGELDGVPGLVLQRRSATDALTFWCEPQPPYRIRHVEKTSDRRLGHDIKFYYDEEAPGGGFLVPRRMELASFSPNRQLLSTTLLTTLSAEVNPEFDAQVFELEPPVGALATDFRQQPWTFQVRMPDGTDRRLAQHEHVNGAFLRTSAAIPGSKVYGLVPVNESPPHPPPIEQGRWLLIALNVIAAVGLLIYVVRRRRQVPRS